MLLHVFACKSKILLLHRKPKLLVRNYFIYRTVNIKTDGFINNTRNPSIFNLSPLICLFVISQKSILYLWLKVVSWYLWKYLCTYTQCCLRLNIIYSQFPQGDIFFIHSPPKLIFCIIRLYAGKRFRGFSLEN